MMSEKVKGVKISDLKPGMIPGKTIINSVDGTVLLRKGVPIDETTISKLKEYNRVNKEIKLGAVSENPGTIFTINGEEHFLPPKVSKFIEKKAISERTQQQALSVAEEVMKNVLSGDNVDAKAVENVVENVLNDILESDNAALNLLNIKNFDDYTYTHSVNVATIALLIGAKLNLSKEDNLKLGVGALMHDLGKIKIPVEILNKSGKLTDEEFAVMKKHPEFTFDIMRNNPDITEIAKEIAAEHHEKVDGSGYPKKLKGKEISYFAKIVAVADVYDALTTNRSYRKAMLPYDAIKIIISGSGTHFDSDIVRTFLRTFSIYPVGSYVRLNTNELAVVKNCDTGNLIKPDILIIKNNEGNDIEPMTVKLTEDRKRYITEAVNIDE